VIWRRRSSARWSGDGQFDACEDAVQEALLAAAVQWPSEGVPDRARSWLLTVATRSLVDFWRTESSAHRAPPVRRGRP
jgi:predicted RNA polymerase sigma factor